MPFPRARHIDVAEQAQLANSDYDALVIIGEQQSLARHLLLREVWQQYQGHDARVGKQAVLKQHSDAPGSRLIIVPTGPLERDYDDVRRFADASATGIKLAVDAGASRVALEVLTDGAPAHFAHAAEAAYLGACQALWQPLEARERFDENVIEPVEWIGMVGMSAAQCEWLNSVEAGRRLARDLCGTNPERMSAIRFAEYCQQAFNGTPVKVEIITPEDDLAKHYPMLFAVARASMAVERHRPRVVRLTYTPPKKPLQSLMFAGKGIVYDTGGADLKVNGHMAGMSRDKGGAAAVAGFMLTVAHLKPAQTEVIAELGLVRNSIGSDAFVPDEIIRSHAGVDVRIGNTDAEGRLVLGDLLSHLRQQAVQKDNVELFSVATLTGHAARAVGPYTALVANGPAHAQGKATRLAAVGDLWGDPSEISRSRREDYSFVAPRTLADDVISSNNAASAVTSRGHQFPMAFLAIASGLDKHGINSQVPLAYTHIDIAGSGVEGGDWQHGKPTASPIVSLAARYLKD